VGPCLGFLCLQLLVVRLASSCCDRRGCVLSVVGWRRRVQCVCFPSYTRAHTFKTKKKKKKIAPVIRVVVVTRRVVTYGIRAGSTRDLGFATAFVDMSWFYYTVADRVDCVRAGNHG
jgi:hypothetical protein